MRRNENRRPRLRALLALLAVFALLLGAGFGDGPAWVRRAARAEGGAVTQAMPGDARLSAGRRKTTPTPKPKKTPKPTSARNENPTPSPTPTASPAPLEIDLLADSWDVTPSPVPQGPIIEPQAIADWLFSHDFTLPDNFITKKEAQALGWSGGDLSRYAPGKSIGGDYFGNYENRLPRAKGRRYTECDCNYTGGRRGEERVIFSNDGLVFYTADHYNTFTQLFPFGMEGSP